ncbi:DUF2029 domain-containing protein [Microbacterium lushaniae]|nr:DUF2029 domain-containing protein [Microbacterium lushaniae]KAA9158652.1 DUF2029 domain-containing protein [Microbacterium lushaniae]
MSRRVPLWIAFVLVHAAVIVLGHVLPSQPMGDVYNVYEPWSRQALIGARIVGIDEPWVYPQIALVPMVLAWGFSLLGGYTIGWGLLATAANALGFGMLVGRGRSRGRRTAAWLWLAAILLLGPVGLFRLDALTVPLALAGCLWLVGRPWLGGALLAVGTWIKVWPAALLAAAVLAVRRRVAVLGAALAVSLATIAVVVLAGGGATVFGFVGDQAVRGLQLEAPVSTPYVWQAALGVPGAAIYFAADIITFEVVGAGSAAVAAAMTPVLVAVVAAVAAAGAVQAWRGASFAALFPPLALALVLAFIVTNKVGSPQYMTWLLPPLLVAVVLDRARWAGPAAVVLFLCGLTQLVYPVLYDRLLTAEVTAVIVLTMRNALVVALFAWMCVRVLRVPVGGRPRAAVSWRGSV